MSFHYARLQVNAIFVVDCILINNERCWFLLLFCIRIMRLVPYVLSTTMLFLLRLMKHRVICVLLLCWRHSTSIG